MSGLVVDASVVIKWVVPESGSDDALSLLLNESRLVAPDLIVAECANILWKKVTRGESRARKPSSQRGFWKKPISSSCRCGT